jgi:hypothetical protein
MLVPLYGFVQGDTVGLVVLVHDHDSIAEVASVLEQAASVRVAPGRRARIVVNGHKLDPELTVAQAALTALDRVDLVPEDG